MLGPSVKKTRGLERRKKTIKGKDQEGKALGEENDLEKKKIDLRWRKEYRGA